MTTEFGCKHKYVIFIQKSYEVDCILKYLIFNISATDLWLENFSRNM
jgi:hypothetical protein